MARENDDGASKLGLRTKASAALAVVSRSSKSARQSKFFNGGETEFTRGGRVQIRRRRRMDVRQESSGGPFDFAKDQPCFKPSSDRVADSCSSSNCSSCRLKEVIECVDVKDENGEDEGEESMYHDDRERNSENIPANEFHTESENLDPMEGTYGGNSSCSSPPDKMPSDAELEEFFSVAEKDNLKHFEQKYNYDVVKDEPLEGRYEWVRLKP